MQPCPELSVSQQSPNKDSFGTMFYDLQTKAVCVLGCDLFRAQ